MAWSGAARWVRLLGLERNGERIRSGALLRAFRLDADVHPVLFEWLSRFDNLRNSRDRSIESVIGELDQLAGESTFVSTEGGQIDLEDESDVDVVVEDIYRRAVLSKPDLRLAAIEDAAEALLEVTEAIRDRTALTPDAEIELLPKGKLGRGLLSFLWFYDVEPHRVGIKALNFDQDPVTVGRQVAELLNSFEVAVARKILEPRGCIVFHDDAASAYPDYLRWISGVATAIDIGSPDAAVRLNNLFVG